MKKKTIKFYFFKHKREQLIFDLIFCLSKNFIKYKNKFIKIKKGFFSVRTKKQKRSFFFIVSYQNILIKRFYFNQWQLIPKKLSNFFLNSNIKKPSNKSLFIMLWYTFKIKYKTFFLKKIFEYPVLGIISSHYVHFLLRKNLTYQNRSKYVPNIFNTNWGHKYITTCGKLSVNYNVVTKSRVHWYCKTLSNRTYQIDENYNLVKYNWNKQRIDSQIINLNKSVINDIYINFVDYNYENLVNVGLLIDKQVKKVYSKLDYNQYLINNFCEDDFLIVHYLINIKIAYNFKNHQNVSYTLYKKFYNLY